MTFELAGPGAGKMAGSDDVGIVPSAQFWFSTHEPFPIALIQVSPCAAPPSSIAAAPKAAARILLRLNCPPQLTDHDSRERTSKITFSTAFSFSVSTPATLPRGLPGSTVPGSPTNPHPP